MTSSPGRGLIAISSLWTRRSWIRAYSSHSFIFVSLLVVLPCSASSPSSTLVVLFRLTWRPPLFICGLESWVECRMPC